MTNVPPSLLSDFLRPMAATAGARRQTCQEVLMLATNYRGPYRIRASQKTDPVIEHPGDAIRSARRSRRSSRAIAPDRSVFSPPNRPGCSARAASTWSRVSSRTCRTATCLMCLGKWVSTSSCATTRPGWCARRSSPLPWWGLNSWRQTWPELLNPDQFCRSVRYSLDSSNVN
jgi:hypothetical protein